MDKKKTAVQWLIENAKGWNNAETSKEMCKKALEMERQQIEEAFDEGNPNGFILKDGKEYFNQTYQ